MQTVLAFLGLVLTLALFLPSPASGSPYDDVRWGNCGEYLVDDIDAKTNKIRMILRELAERHLDSPYGSPNRAAMLRCSEDRATSVTETIHDFCYSQRQPQQVVELFRSFSVRLLHKHITECSLESRNEV